MINQNNQSLESEKAGARRVVFITVDEDMAGQRLDNFLIRFCKGVPKSHIYRLLRKGEVRVNKKRCKPDYRLQPNDLVRIPPIRLATATKSDRPSKNLADQLESRVLYEDPQLMIINKPAGMAVHGGSGINLGLIEALRAIRNNDRLELIHRLDRGTSGCLMVAKKRSALRAAQESLRLGQVRKKYLALVKGRWRAGKRVDQPLHKYTLSTGERRVKVSVEGKASVSVFQVRKHFGIATLVEVDLLTGRTHQIRVHAQSQGHPLAGDEKYGDEAFNGQMKALGLSRLFLHAFYLAIKHPATGEQLVCEAPLEDGLQKVIERMI